MNHAKNEKREKKNKVKNRAAKSIKNQNACRTYKYLGMLEADTIKQAEMKEKITKESIRRTKELLETKLYSRNLIKK